MHYLYSAGFFLYGGGILYAKRCYYYLEDKNIVRQEFELEWFDSMNYNQKQIAVYNIEKAIPLKYGPATDVSGSSQYRDIRDLSIFKLQSKRRGMNFYQYWNEIVMKRSPVAKDIPGMFCFMYLSAMDCDDRNAILRYNCFYDIYNNPDKVLESAALAYIAWKLLVLQNKADYLADPVKFMYWFLVNTSVMKIKKDLQEE